MKISKKNALILTWPPDHPARRFLEMHSHFCSECIGCELGCLRGGESIEQEWYSCVISKQTKLSDVLYKYLSFTPILSEWVFDAERMSEKEKADMSRIAECRALLNEGREASIAGVNHPATKIINQAIDVLDVWEQSIVARGGN